MEQEHNKSGRAARAGWGGGDYIKTCNGKLFVLRNISIAAAAKTTAVPFCICVDSMSEEPKLGNVCKLLYLNVSKVFFS